MALAKVTEMKLLWYIFSHSVTNLLLAKLERSTLVTNISMQESVCCCHHCDCVLPFEAHFRVLTQMASFWRPYLHDGWSNSLLVFFWDPDQFAQQMLDLPWVNSSLVDIKYGWVIIELWISWAGLEVIARVFKNVAQAGVLLMLHMKQHGLEGIGHKIDAQNFSIISTSMLQDFAWDVTCKLYTSVVYVKQR